MKHIFLLYIIIPILTIVLSTKAMDTGDNQWIVTSDGTYQNSRGKVVVVDKINFRTITTLARNGILTKVAALPRVEKHAFSHNIQGATILYHALSPAMQNEIITLQFDDGQRYHFHVSEVKVLPQE